MARQETVLSLASRSLLVLLAGCMQLTEGPPHVLEGETATALPKPPAQASTGQLKDVHSPIKELQSADSDARWKASWALSRMGSVAVPALVELLKRDDPKLRFRAAQTLGRMKSHATDGIPALIGALKDPDTSVRRASARALGMIAGEDSDSVLRRTFDLPPRETVRTNRKVVSALIGVLKDEAREVRWAGAEALAQIGPAASEAVPALLEALDDLERGPGYNVHAAAARALETIGPDAKSALPGLVKALSDEDASVRLHAAGMLGMMGSDAKETVPQLIRVLATTGHRRWIKAGNAVMNVGPSAVPALIDAPDIRKAAAEALRQVEARG